MKAMSGNLRLDTKYKIIKIIAGDEYDFTTCDNCGNLIRHRAVVEDLERKKYTIGLDCADVLVTQLGNSCLDELALLEMKKQFRKELKLIKFMKSCKTIIVNKSTNTMWLYEKETDKFTRYWKWICDYNKYKKYIDKDTKIIYE